MEVDDNNLIMMSSSPTAASSSLSKAESQNMNNDSTSSQSFSSSKKLVQERQRKQPKSASSSSSLGGGNKNNNNPWSSWTIIRQHLCGNVESKEEEDGVHPSDVSTGRSRNTVNGDSTKVDDLLAQEMKALSMEEREQVYDDIHGVASVREETPEFINHAIQQLDDELVNMSHSKKRNYTRALFLRPALANDEKFKLMFLRADLYNPHAAATRLVKHFDMKYELFGVSKLGATCPMTIDDILKEDTDYIRSGFGVMLPFKDQSGRHILFVDYRKLDPTLPLGMDQIKSAVSLRVCLCVCVCFFTFFLRMGKYGARD